MPQHSTEKRRAADFAAHAISFIVSPVILPIATTAILLWLLGANRSQTLAALAYTGFAFCIVPLAYILWMVSNGKATSLDVPNRNERTEPLTVTILAGLVGLFIYLQAESAIDLVGILAITLVANLVFILVINTFWKISVHAMAVGGMLGVVVYMIGPAFGLANLIETWLVAILIILVPLVMWARLQLRVHTPAQVTAGAALGFVGQWAGFYWATRMVF
ncbi:MAG TPA: phosphatase PAP2 family protein [Rhodothermales bacterium]|nr:phosphatase PAP2 family protein [Rhodothermales bacterium]